MSLSIAAGGVALLVVVFLLIKVSTGGYLNRGAFHPHSPNTSDARFSQVKKSPRGTPTMNTISDRIRSGAIAFLRTEYKYLTAYVLVFFALLLILYTVEPPSGYKTDGIRYAGSFLAGAFLSAGTGWAGMLVATDANVRTTEAADKHGLDRALGVAFTGGSVMVCELTQILAARTHGMRKLNLFCFTTALTVM